MPEQRKIVTAMPENSETPVEAVRSWVTPQARYSWTLWEYLWEADTVGEHTLRARATSEGSQVQPRDHEPLCGGYCIHHSRPITIQLAAQRRHNVPADLDALLYDMNAFAEPEA